MIVDCRLCAQVPDSLPLTGLSTQLSMAQGLMQPDALFELRRLGSDAKLSIFDDILTRPDVSPSGVVARVLTAAKGWQKYKSPAGKTAQEGCAVDPSASGEAPGQSSVAGNACSDQSVCVELADSDTAGTAEIVGSGIAALEASAVAEAVASAVAGDGSSTAVEGSAVDVAVASAVAGEGSSAAGASSAVADATACEVATAVVRAIASEASSSAVPSSSGNNGSSGAARHRVGFADSAEECALTELIAVASAGLVEAAGEGTQAEQLATAADLRARIAASMRRLVIPAVHIARKRSMHSMCIHRSSDIERFLAVVTM